MARARVFYKISRPATIAVVGPMVDQAAYRVAQAMRGRAISNIRTLGRVDTGAMIRGLQVRRQPGGSPLIARYEVASTARSANGFDYVAAQEYGTRAHGPVVATHMVFQIRGAGPVIFAKWVKGVTPGRFMANALRDARLSDATNVAY